MNKGTVTGFILAGGKSTRMGTDKGMLLYNGIPLIQHTARILGKLCSKVVISSKSDVYGFTGLECWPDELPIDAPITGIYTCLKRSPTRLNIFLPLDMPLVPAEFLEELLSAAHSSDLVIPVHKNDRFEPLCAVYSRNLLPLLEDHIARNQLSLTRFALDALPLKFRATKSSFYNPGIFTNVNTASEFDLLGNS